MIWNKYKGKENALISYAIKPICYFEEMKLWIQKIMSNQSIHSSNISIYEYIIIHSFKPIQRIW